MMEEHIVYRCDKCQSRYFRKADAESCCSPATRTVTMVGLDKGRPVDLVDKPVKLTEMPQFLDEFNEIMDDFKEMISELRFHMSKIYDLSKLISLGEYLEDRIMDMEKQFIKEFKTEKVEDKIEKSESMTVIIKSLIDEELNNLKKDIKYFENYKDKDGV